MLVVVFHIRKVRIDEVIGENPPAAALRGRDLAARRALPATLPFLLVLPLLRVADTGLGFDIVEPGVFNALARGPDILAGDRAGMAADTFIEVQHHRDLCT